MKWLSKKKNLSVLCEHTSGSPSLFRDDGQFHAAVTQNGSGTETKAEFRCEDKVLLEKVLCPFPKGTSISPSI